MRLAGKVREMEGVLGKPKKIEGKKLAETTMDLVTQFYYEDSVSRTCPGVKDYVSVKTVNGREQRVKRLVLGNLKDVYQTFKKKYPDVQVGFSKFAEARPKECVLAGVRGTHAVCVCTIHQNVKLMIDGGRIQRTYNELLSDIVCHCPTEACKLGQC